MKLSPHCYAVLGMAYCPPWAVNAGFIAGEHTTLVVDAGPHAQGAATLFGYAGAVRPGNNLRLLNTERHLDHIGGNAYFHTRGVESYGHPAIRRSDAELAASIAECNACIPGRVRRNAQEAALIFAGTHIANPTHALGNEASFDLGGGIEVQIIPTPGHTPTNLSAWLLEEGVLYCGDTLLNGYIPNLEGGTPDDWRIWLASLEQIASLAPTTIVPGHGWVLQGEAIEQEMDRIGKILKQAISHGKAPTV
ncbi:MAG: MBL fold metallo-hydrolase [Chloroflexota bacterium]